MVQSPSAAAADYTLGLRTGLPVSPVPATGLEAHIHFGSFSVGLSHVSGSYDIRDDVNDDTSVTTVQRAIASASMSLLELRYFAFWGLNGTVGLGQRTMGLSYDIDDVASTASLEGELEARSFVITHTIGLEWHFDWWYFSADGIGYAYPLSTSTNSEVSTAGNLSGDLGEVNQDLNDVAKEMGHVITKQLFLLSLGILM